MIKNLIFALLCLQGFIAVSYCEMPKHDWPHELSDLKPDPRIVHGKLNNGFRYVFMPNKQLPKHFSVHLYVDAGSLMENDEEQGLAHFLEHMGFRGIPGYPGDEIDQTLRRLGSESDALTYFDKTVYKLNFIDNSHEHLEHSLRMLSGIAHGMLLDEDLIKKEMGVVLAEKRDTESVTRKLGFDWRIFAYEGLIINQRLPIGIESVIKSANSNLLRNFYKKWYRPERMILVVVGDLNRDELASCINSYFSVFSDLSESPEEPDLGTLTYGQGLRARIYKNEELSGTTVALTSLKPYQLSITNKEGRKKEIYRSIAYQILNERIEELSTQESTTFQSGSAFSGVEFDMLREATIEMQCEPDQVLQALKVAENELRKVFEYGFTDEEFNRYKHEELYSYKSDSVLGESVKTDDLIESLLDITVDEGVYTSNSFDCEFANEFLENEASKERCLEVFKDDWALDNLLIYLYTNSRPECTEAQLQETYNTSKEIPLEAPQERGVLEYNYHGENEKGVIIDEQYNSKLDCYQYRFSNNVRINLKQTNYDKRLIWYEIAFGNGEDQPHTKPAGIETVAGEILQLGGVGKLSFEELNRALAGKGIDIPSIDIASNAFTISSSVMTPDFEGQMNLICGYLMEPAYRDEGLKQMHKGYKNSYNKLNKTIDGIMSLEVTPYLFDGHPDYKLDRLEDLIARTPAEVQDWLKDVLTESYMEVSIVGDFDKDQVLESLSKTLGALPKRRESKVCYKDIPNVRLRQGSSKQVFGYDSTLPQAKSIVCWDTPKSDNDQEKIMHTVKAEVLADVIGERLFQKVITELGEGYSVSAEIDFSNVIVVSTMTDPDKAKYLCELIAEIVATMVAEGITEDEFNRVIIAKLLVLESSKSTNSYWLRRLSRAQEYPFEIKNTEFFYDYYKKLKLEEINEAAREYLQPKKAVHVMIVPESHRKKVKAMIRESLIKKLLIDN